MDTELTAEELAALAPVTEHGIFATPDSPWRDGRLVARVVFPEPITLHAGDTLPVAPFVIVLD